jgi:hypothetical protein
MHYNEIKTFIGTSIRTQRLCAGLLAINIAIAERICVCTITWVVNGMGETLAAFHSLFPMIPTNGGLLHPDVMGLPCTPATPSTCGRYMNVHKGM